MFNYFFEFKVRSFYCCLFFLFLLSISFFYKESILYLLVEPSKSFTKTSSPYFIYTNLTEVFSTYLRMVLLVSVYFTIPLCFYQIWLFFSPGLYNKEALKIKYWILFITLNYFFITYFLYDPILFWSWKFFSNFETSDITSVNLYFEAKLNEYFSFLVYLYFYTGFFLQFFLISFLSLFLFISKNLQKIILFRKYFYIGVIIFAALITPPDVISQIIIAGHLISCFEILLICLFIKKEYLYHFSNVNKITSNTY